MRLRRKMAGPARARPVQQGGVQAARTEPLEIPKDIRKCPLWAGERGSGDQPLSVFALEVPESRGPNHACAHTLETLGAISRTGGGGPLFCADLRRPKRRFLRHACIGTAAAASQGSSPMRPKSSAARAHARNFPFASSTHHDAGGKVRRDSTSAIADAGTPAPATCDRQGPQADRYPCGHIQRTADYDEENASRDPSTGCRSLGHVGCLDVRLAAERAAALLDASKTGAWPPVFDLRQQKSC